MKKLFIFLTVIIGLLAAVIFALPFVLPMNMIHEKVIAMVNEKSGGDLQINGQTSFSILPTPSINLNKIRFKTSPDAPTSTIILANSVKVKVKLLPLLSKKIEVNEFIIYQPEIDITVLKNKPASAKKVKADKTPAASPQAQSDVPNLKGSITTEGTPTMPLSDISLDNVRIVDGTIRYKDEKTGATQHATKINASVKLKDLNNPLSIESDMIWHEKKIAINADIVWPKVLFEPINSPIKVSMNAPDITLNFDGKLDRSKQVNLVGALKMHSKSVRNLMVWADQVPPVPGGLEKLDINSNIDFTPKRIKLTKTKLHLDKSKMDGHLTLFTQEAKPRITGTLALDYLNLNSYLTKSKVYGWSSQNGEFKIAKNTALKAANDNKPSDKLDFTALNGINADLNLTLGGLRYKDIKLNKTSLHLTIKNALLKANLTNMALYKGHGKGVMTLNGKTANSAISSDFDLKNVAILPLLTDAAKFKWLSGSGNVKFSMKGHGTTLKNLKKTLNGTSDIKFFDGAIEGINIPSMVRNVTSGALLGMGKNKAEKTDFSDMTAHFDIKNGVVHNNDLHLASPLLRVKGKGTANLVTERIDYRVEPKIVSSLEGQAGAKSASGINIPVNIKGPFSSPSIKPDLSAMLKDPKKLLSGAKDIGRSLKNLGKSKELKSLLKGLF